MVPLDDRRAEEYALKIQEIVYQLKKSNKKALAENEVYLVSNEDAKAKYGGRVGEIFYVFPNEAPSQEIIDAYESVKPYYGTGLNAISFERHLSHRGMTVMFVGKDLVIRKDRIYFSDRLTEINLKNAIEKTKDSNQIDMANAKIYIFPYKSMYFFISDSFEPQFNGSTGEYRIPENWFSIPFRDDYNYKIIRQQCREFANRRPMKSVTSIDVILDDVKKMIVRNLAKELYASHDIDSKIEHENISNEGSESIAYSVVKINQTEQFAKGHSNLPKSFVAIDFETLYPQRVSACSVGMVKYRDGEIVDRYYTLIRPPFDYPGKCGKVLTWVHGLTEEMVRDAKTFEELLPEMETFVDGLPLVAHHACVEKACIRDTCAFYGIDTSLDYEGIYDTLDLSRRAEAKLGISEEGPGTHQLDAVCRRFGISGDNHHHALADAEMSGNLMLVFQKVFEGAESVEVKESEPAANGVFTPRQKYNPEDMIQRTDLENVPDNPFKNKVVVLTGFAKADSKEYAHQLNEFGAIIKDGVNKKTNILITGYNAGPAKMQKAEELGVRIMLEAEYKEIISHLNK